MPETAFVLAAHGTADPRGLREAANLAAGVRALRPGRAVRLAFLEKAEPGLAEGLDWAATRARTVVLVPLLLNSGSHLATDLPTALAAAGRRHPAVRFRMAGSLADEPTLPRILTRRLAEVRGRLPEGPASAVLAAHGARDPRTREEVARLAAETARHCALPVHPAFTSLGPPGLETVLHDLDGAGYTGTVVLSHRLFDGRLQDNLIRRCGEASRGLARLRVAAARPYGPDPELCAAIAELIHVNDAPREQGRG
jgi:sirohydrochlorin ferrochelatase